MNMPNFVRPLCREIGARLARMSTVQIVHGGLKKRPRSRSFSVDWHVIQGAKTVLKDDTADRIETILASYELVNSASEEAAPDPAKPGSPKAESFVEGTLKHLGGRTREARRFGFVRSLDALIAIGGRTGTRQQLTLAHALDLPVISVPCVAGSSQRFWKNHRDELIERLKVNPSEAREWEEWPEELPRPGELAGRLVGTLAACLKKRAFVIMPFDEQYDTLYELVIERGLAGIGHEVIRTDRSGKPGDAIQHIEVGIRSADYCVVVLDGYRPNVLYEMGYAQALNKDMVILHSTGANPEEQIPVPFDISTQQRINYARPDSATLEQLLRAAKSITQSSTPQI